MKSLVARRRRRRHHHGPAARRIGLRAICVDQRDDAPALRHADEHLSVSTRDLERLTAILADRDDVAGVLSPASDVNLPSQYHLARHLGLPTGLSEAAVRASLDKGFFRAVCDRLGQPGPRYVQGSPEEVLAAATDLTYPVMVKPTDSSGGRGVSQCTDPASRRRRWRQRRTGRPVGSSSSRSTSSRALHRRGGSGGRAAVLFGRRALTPHPTVTISTPCPAPRQVSQQVHAMLTTSVGN